MNDFHFITQNPWQTDEPHRVTFKIRHTPDCLTGTLIPKEDGRWFLQADKKIHGVAPGQFCVVYDEDHHLCYGSGEIN